MAKYLEDQLDLIFFALSHPTRREILGRLKNGELSVTDASKGYDGAGPTISKHLGVMENAGLIKRTKRGRVNWLHLQPDLLKDLEKWMVYYREFWEGQLDSLDTYMSKLTKRKKHEKK